MEHNLTFLLDIALILIFANIGGYISKKLKQPSVLGQILAGLLVGPSVLNLINTGVSISHMAEIGVILLMFIAGLETDLRDLKASGKSSTFIAIGGIVVPLLAGILAIYLTKPGADFTEALFVGVILTATSVSITVQALRELGKLRTRQGIGILGAAIIDDVAGIIILTLVVGIAAPSESVSIFLVIGKIVSFFILSIVVGIVFSKLLTKYSDIVSRENRILTAALIFCFLLAFIAEELGVAAIIGAYFTGVLFSTTPHRNRVSHEIQRIAYSLFTPIFFMNIGLNVRLDHIGGTIGISIALILAAILGKVIGCGIGAKLSNFKTREALQISIGMIPRAEVALIVANLGLKMQIIGHEIFTSTILIVLATTIVTPPLLKLAFNNDADELPMQQDCV
ncbi:cation:proton antiporter [Caldisalinibacter kiritimatiensis]|uniref:Na+/H+ antiporter n=1 Tax=Caldisalinibacter kiritimatiensis TaxID=1304284 RepID=R1AX29_9FIRM|nr:cation:proton antiporter [Caldisalinibacter kiritimatiensis]EOD01763.1 Na+/H+ antiporter [Caldisalinibacter kiritimatiensis]